MHNITGSSALSWHAAQRHIHDVLQEVAGIPLASVTVNAVVQTTTEAPYVVLHEVRIFLYCVHSRKANSIGAWLTKSQAKAPCVRSLPRMRRRES